MYGMYGMYVCTYAQYLIMRTIGFVGFSPELLQLRGGIPER